MATPLVAQKSSSRSGTIVQGEETRSKVGKLRRCPPSACRSPRNGLWIGVFCKDCWSRPACNLPTAQGTALQGQPTKVVLLRNMVRHTGAKAAHFCLPSYLSFPVFEHCCSIACAAGFPLCRVASEQQ